MKLDAPISIDDPINRRILVVSEDQVAGFHRRPFDVIAERSGVDRDTVLQRIGAMLEAGTIRRVRQTLLATNLAHGALVAWRIDNGQLQAGFDWLAANDPFSGHVVIRSTDAEAPGSAFKLWTTLKVPQGFSLEKHCQYLCNVIGADCFIPMPAKRLFKLGVGHMRRKDLKPGDRAESAQAASIPQITRLDDEQWRVLIALKRELSPEEIVDEPWTGRADEAGVSIERFCEVAERLNELGVIGRFSTFLEHAKPVSGSVAVTRYNGLFHWAVPAGREIEAGTEVGRHHCMTHAYWREGGPQFNHVNIMGVVHGTEKQPVLAHKAAIDEHLAEAGIPVHYTNVFWGGRSEIKPSEISPIAYRQWCRRQGIDPQIMRGQ